VIDLRDFETKQIVVNPIFKSEHGGAFVTPNTEYVIEAAQYASPLENKKFYPLEEFNEKYRGGVTYWKFDRKEGRIDVKESFSVELPPYSQDLSDAGKGPSDGWSFTNSFCSERYVGGIEKGRPPYEAGCSAKDTDYLHIVNWKKAAELVAQGKAKKINGHNVLMMETAIKEGILFLVPEPKSPHGVMLSPDGKFITVSGKLDTHVSVYSGRFRPPSRLASSNQGSVRHSGHRHEGSAAYPGSAWPRPPAPSTTPRSVLPTPRCTSTRRS
jgi:nitrous-oxide reductase